MSTLKVAADTNRLEEIQDFIGAELEKAGCGIRMIMRANVVAEEVFVNIAQYAYGDEKGDAVIDVNINDSEARISFKDWGVSYNPLLNEDPDITLPAEKRPIGGLGIFMIKEMTDDVIYERRDGCNILTIIFHL